MYNVDSVLFFLCRCAGVCSYEGHGGLCSIRLSEPLLKFRPRKDLVETLLVSCVITVTMISYFAMHIVLLLLWSYQVRLPVYVTFYSNNCNRNNCNR